MAKWVNRSFTRWDLWGLPGLLLIVGGLALEWTVSDHVGSYVLGVGIAYNLVFAFRRTKREYGYYWPYGR